MEKMSIKEFKDQSNIEIIQELMKINNGYITSKQLTELGIHRMYLGYVGIGILQLFLSIFTCGISSLWGFIEGILILCGSGITTDSDGNPLI